MIVFFGKRMYGKVEGCGPSYIATRFFYLQFLPIIPLGSLLVLEDLADGQVRAVDIGFHLGSVLAGYLRTWGLVAAAVMLFALVGGLSNAQGVGEAAAELGVIALVGLFLAGAFTLGRLSRDRRARHRVYADFIGYPVDAMRLPGDSGIRDRLHGGVVERARSFATVDYRTAYDPQQEWAQIALAPTTNDAQLVRSCLTLTRLDMGRARGAERVQLKATHDQLWTKLKTLDPKAAAA